MSFSSVNSSITLGPPTTRPFHGRPPEHSMRWSDSSDNASAYSSVMTGTRDVIVSTDGGLWEVTVQQVCGVATSRCLYGFQSVLALAMALSNSGILHLRFANWSRVA